MEIKMLPEIYQTTLINFGNDVYIGSSFEEAKAAALKAGFESVVLLDGAYVGSYSPIKGWVEALDESVASKF